MQGFFTLRWIRKEMDVLQIHLCKYMFPRLIVCQITLQIFHFIRHPIAYLLEFRRKRVLLRITQVQTVFLQILYNLSLKDLWKLVQVALTHTPLTDFVSQRGHLQRLVGLHVQIVRQGIGLERLDLLPNLQQHVMLLVKLRSQLETKLLVAFQVAPNRFIALIYPIQAIFRLLHDRVLLIHQFVDWLNHLFHLILHSVAYRFTTLCYLFVIVYGTSGKLVQIS